MQQNSSQRTSLKPPPPPNKQNHHPIPISQLYATSQHIEVDGKPAYTSTTPIANSKRTNHINSNSSVPSPQKVWLHGSVISGDSSSSCGDPTQRTESLRALPQLDGPREYNSYMNPAEEAVRAHPAGHVRASNTRSTGRAQGSAPKSAIRDLLPFCTAEAPLTEEQVIGLSDMAGSLKEVMLLALRAQRDEQIASELIRAVGPEAARGIVEFFTDEFEV